MEIKKGKNCYYIGEDENNYKGILTFEEKGDIIDATHTIVKPEYSGQGFAGELFKKLVEDARSDNKKIKGTCSYVHKKLESSEFDDIRA
ncbi:MAG: N-acetyltransferase [Peptoniphilus sp.]|uniref:GNAT family N-acetyltransferase n=1 Tax=Peptoniphilus sp. TaxID=1971214 RepID=UPI0025CDD811|nr:GNAT family N-acetyltransferase [Peptoniphilus sp.]MCI5643707.1 N-acetyltransferase [Peptoniphilus sp.]MDD7351874.1 GNAT family N-acetyltransferase [Peptoniphilaceae bacterium]MDY3902303.1 GNAT family N-acetyltransferase [Peptoniphilus sp.]